MANLDRRAAEAFFSQKVPGSVRSEGARHIAYRVFSPSGRLLLGNLTMSRGASGQELDLRNLKGLATDMGLSLEGFIEASGCRIRPEAVVLCIASRILEDALMMHQLDAVSFDDSMIVLLGRAIEEWFESVPKGAEGKLGMKEGKEIGRCMRRLEMISSHDAFKVVAGVFLARAGKIAHG